MTSGGVPAGANTPIQPICTLVSAVAQCFGPKVDANEIRVDADVAYDDVNGR